MFQELVGARPALVEIGIGDDAAVWRPAPGRAALATTDLLIEEVHFSLRFMSWYDTGWKAMAANVSDIAAMGGVPRAAFVSAGLSPSMATSDARELYRGLAECAAEYEVAILGGDTVASPAAAVVNVALYGESLSVDGAVLRRDAARAGDAIGVSGPLGGSAAFLRTQEARFRAAHVHPKPRVALGQALLQAGIRCAMDISDGLLADLGKLCAASGLGAVVRGGEVPVAPGASLELALTGGEDYELLSCGPRNVLEQAGLTVIGEIVADGSVSVVDAAGATITFESVGYDAFR